MDAYIDGCYKKDTYVRCYDSVICSVNDPDQWKKTDFDNVMLPSYRKPSHRLVNKRKRDPEEAEDRSQSHLSRRGKIQRCSNCGESGHKKGGCTKPPSVEITASSSSPGSAVWVVVMALHSLFEFSSVLLGRVLRGSSVIFLLS
ncbi:hypothetical protein Ahy_A07g035479 [Arachis hypogaea]|uniref:CCHC-type domain-containing protein n=1 Tax=Arachis hypogaea TaxID=3818 RepID=A0A445CE25_ARAHY|nr:hypothetical protein Ahy_A07g035479 [Arachis hypogaea]